MEKASLTVVGSGIKFISHLTTEAKSYIEQSEKVLYLVNEPAMKEWIQQSNPNAESLDELYLQHNLRADSYNSITNYILDVLRQNKHVCVVIYGHPTVFAMPALEAVKQAKREGYFAKVLPGISAEDCLFADLLINPGENGCISLEATDLLIHDKQIDTSCHLIIWQASIIGALNHTQLHDNTNGIQLLLNYLKQYYESTHIIVLYTAAQYPGMEPIIKEFALEELPSISQSRTSMLYISPAKKNTSNKKSLKALNMLEN